VKSKSKDTVVNNEIIRIDSLISKIEKSLYQTNNKSNQDPLNFPIKLTNKLAHINSLATINAGDFRPTASMIEVKGILEKEINAQLAIWSDIKSYDIPKLNKLVRDRGIDIFKVDEVK
jgi:hypothetical protein